MPAKNPKPPIQLLFLLSTLLQSLASLEIAEGSICSEFAATQMNRMDRLLDNESLASEGSAFMCAIAKRLTQAQSASTPFVFFTDFGIRDLNGTEDRRYGDRGFALKVSLEFFGVVDFGFGDEVVQ